MQNNSREEIEGVVVCSPELEINSSIQLRGISLFLGTVLCPVLYAYAGIDFAIDPILFENRMRLTLEQCKN